MYVATTVLSRVNLKVKLFIEETIRTTCMAVVVALNSRTADIIIHSARLVFSWQVVLISLAGQTCASLDYVWPVRLSQLC